MTMKMSQEGLDRLTKPWEEYCAWPYDDKLAKRRNPATGRYELPEYKGGGLAGTLTQGYGHTDSDEPKIVLGSRWTEAEADEILLKDMVRYEVIVNRYLKVNVSQHVYDGLVDLCFNCPSAIPHVVGLINAGNKRGAENAMMQYVMSRGEYMVGLTHRRTAEVAWMNTPDSPDEAEATIISPKAEREPAPKTMAHSKTGAAAVATASAGAGSVVAGIQAANDAADVVKTAGHHLNEARDTLADAGFFDHVVRFAHSPSALIVGGCIVVALAVFVWADRRWKLVHFHV